MRITHECVFELSSQGSQFLYRVDIVTDDFLGVRTGVAEEVIWSGSAKFRLKVAENVIHVL